MTIDHMNTKASRYNEAIFRLSVYAHGRQIAGTHSSLDWQIWDRIMRLNGKLAWYIEVLERENVNLKAYRCPECGGHGVPVDGCDVCGKLMVAYA